MLSTSALQVGAADQGSGPVVYALTSATSAALSARAEVRAAQARSAAARSEVDRESALRNLTVGGEVTATTGSPGIGSSVLLRSAGAPAFVPTTRERTVVTAGVTSRLPLMIEGAWRGRRTTQEMQAEVAFRQAVLREHAARLAVAQEVGEAYFAAVQATQEAEFVRRVSEVQTERRNLVRARYEGGILGLTDLLKAEGALLEAQQASERADIARQTALSQLAVAIGLSPDTDVAVTPAKDLAAPTADVNELAAQAKLHRPETALATLELEVAKLEVAAAAREHKPTVDAVLGYVDVLDESEDGDLWRMGLSAQIPLLDGGLQRANLGAARARVAQREQEAAEAEQALSREVAEAYGRVLRAEREIGPAERRLANAKRMVDAWQKQYEQGLVPMTEVLTARSDALNAEKELAVARQELLAASFALQVSLGTLPSEPSAGEERPAGAR